MKKSIFLLGLLSFVFAACDSTDEQVIDNVDKKAKSIVEYDFNGQQYVDLGLPSGNLWALANMGGAPLYPGPDVKTAKMILPQPWELIGSHFAWGEICKKDVFTPENYAYYHTLPTGFTIEDLGTNISGTNYDVAKNLWCGDWQLPDREDFEELINYCSFEWRISKRHPGAYSGQVVVTGPSGKHLWFFLDPHDYCGCKEYCNHDNPNTYFLGHYWTGEAVASADGSTEPGLYAYALELDEQGLRITSEHPKYEKAMVRPVIKPKKK